jgi:hypothetical protein
MILSSLEREIIEKFHQLQPDAKQRIRALIEQEVEQAEGSTFDYDAWFRDVETLRQQMHKHAPIDIVGMLRDLRDGEDE